jgi:purine nucleosidase/pyrimidine-specific ribonucleoside hydrolase
MTIPVIIDTDPGVDDALALLLALQSPELAIKAVTTVSGNVPVDRATRNVFRVFDLLPSAARPPVAQGSSGPLRKSPTYAHDVHGDDGLGNLDYIHDSNGLPCYPEPKIELSGRAAVDEILYQLSVASEPLTIIALGPLTNIAAAIQKSPKQMSAVKRIVVMGGAVQVPGNITSVAEFNIYVDPHAADVVFKSGIELTVVGLNVTRQVYLTRDNIDAICAPHDSAASRFVRDCTQAPLNFTEEYLGKAFIYLHDPLAVAVAIDFTLVTTEPMHIGIELQGKLTEGMTVADRRLVKSAMNPSPNAHVSVNVNVDGFLSFFGERVLMFS